MWKLLLLSAMMGVLESKEEPSRGHLQLRALHCPPCERIHCSSRWALRLQCKGGVTTGVCGCCPVCARMEGETCGGAWHYLGKCDQGLVCVDQAGEGERRGVCKTVIEQQDLERCHPECTKEYCQQHSLKICSARLVSLMKKPCHGSCVHTSCSSCFLLQCPTCSHSCSPSDSSCMHRFGKCVHSHLAATNSCVCHSTLQADSDGHFVCLVPACESASK
ncbi:serine protease HTRA3 [Gouania willdenowi]|uniref:serine protease HTRA3 n=1 Tax=Gouania willdenowi TaxID=441366 RepID=UPI001054A2D3|nr:serine protease HTRA3-like [Gouania willdenowi]